MDLKLNGDPSEGEEGPPREAEGTTREACMQDNTQGMLSVQEARLTQQKRMKELASTLKCDYWVATGDGATGRYVPWGLRHCWLEEEDQYQNIL